MASISIIFGGQEQKSVPLDKARMVVGREPTCEIHIDNLGISRQHCAFSQRGDAFVVQDLGSSNGTYVNGKKITEHFLNNDDEVVIGKYSLKFKNETQAGNASADASKGEAGVPDTLNTYVMDGAKIQEQLAKMRAEREGAGAKPGEVAPPPPGATAKDYAKALDAASTAPESGKMKTYLIALGAVVVVLIIVVAVLMAVLMKNKQGP